MTAAAPHPHHTVRFYIVMSTLIIGGIFFLLFMNNNDGNFSLAGAVIKSFDNDANIATDSLDAKDTIIDETERPPTSRRPAAKESAKDSLVKQSTAQNEVEIVLVTDQVPNFKRKARFGNLELKLRDLTTTIRINGDKLEVYDLAGESKIMRMTNAIGVLDFDEDGVYVDVTASSFEVNDVAISSKSDSIKITFDGFQEYLYFSVENFDVSDFSIPRGDGVLQVAEKLTYKLEQDSLTIETFDGSIKIGQENFSGATTLTGLAKGISISGSKLDVDLS
jgi:hypothetical protein